MKYVPDLIRSYDTPQKENRVFSTRSILFNQKLLHSREIYGFMAIIGDLGGVHELLYATTCSLIGIYATHSYMLKAIQKMYLGNTSDQDFFDQEKRNAGQKYITMKTKIPEALHA